MQGFVRTRCLFLLALACGLFWSSPLAVAASLTREMALSYCDEKDIVGALCLSARDYPNPFPPELEGSQKTVCNISVDEIYNIIDRTNIFAVLPFITNCSGHANLDGGSILLRRRDGGSFAFLGYGPGLRPGTKPGTALDCGVVRRNAIHEDLYCISWFQMAGIATTTPMRLHVDGGRLRQETFNKIGGVEEVSANGNYSVRCEKPARRAFIELGNLTKGPRNGTVLMDGHYVDADTVTRDCRRLPGSVKSSLVTAGVKVVEVPIDDVKSARFLYNSNNGAFDVY